MLTLYYKVIKIINIVCRKNNHFYPLHTHGVPLIASGKDMLTTQIFHSGANFPPRKGSIRSDTQAMGMPTYLPQGIFLIKCSIFQMISSSGNSPRTRIFRHTSHQVVPHHSSNSPV